MIDVKDASRWYHGALGELHAQLAAQKVTPAGPGGAIYANELFGRGHGRATAFVPCGTPLRATGQVSALVVPQAELAVITHCGAHHDADLAYGSLAAHVTDRRPGVRRVRGSCPLRTRPGEKYVYGSVANGTVQ